MQNKPLYFKWFPFHLPDKWQFFLNVVEHLEVKATVMWGAQDCGFHQLLTLKPVQTQPPAIHPNHHSSVPTSLWFLQLPHYISWYQLCFSAFHLSLHISRWFSLWLQFSDRSKKTIDSEFNIVVTVVMSEVMSSELLIQQSWSLQWLLHFWRLFLLNMEFYVDSCFFFSKLKILLHCLLCLVSNEILL